MVRIDHIGSTSVAGIKAKDLIDPADAPVARDASACLAEAEEWAAAIGLTGFGPGAGLST